MSDFYSSVEKQESKVITPAGEKGIDNPMYRQSGH